MGWLDGLAEGADTALSFLAIGALLIGGAGFSVGVFVGLLIARPEQPAFGRRR
ncbi:MAG: hypothetical protein R3F62_23860 [Planctomycetota bacterium]